MPEPIYQRVTAEVKVAMKARDKARLGALRLIMADFKRIEVDERIELDDERVLVILDKMTKQRKDSLKQFEDAGREDLANQEALEIAVIAEFLPDQLSDDEVSGLVKAAIAETGAASMQDMGKVMAIVKPQVQGKADMGAVSGLVKAQLS
ncbi:MAG: GatB/YqeY domain-containing protein [Gammaproteobacteria bacterium]|nr:GatB/YqeY domain-containing protein [Gammaproteobacteria bacterium]MBT7174683.1 GatB/YqeY domain-containing protein [Gammaproteobacteria bacterium]